MGAAFVRTDPAVRQQWSTATYETSSRALAVISPADADETAQCVRIAAEHRVALYPVSRGRNWGLGSRVPPKDAVVLDLSRLTRISSFDAHFGTIIVEPGVTFQALAEYLSQQGGAWFFPAIGGPASSSVVGNIVERGDASGPYRDRLASIASLRVLLGDGTVLDTGFERFGNTALNALSASPAGPAIHSIFTQSNFGIVLRASLWLSPTPAHFQVVHGKISHGSLAACLDAMQGVVLNLGECIALSVWNGDKLASRAGSLGSRPADWYFTAGLYAPSASIAAGQKELVSGALPPALAQLDVLDEAGTPDLRALAGAMLGTASDANLKSLYSEMPTVPAGELDPDRDGCGAIWLCPELPFKGELIEAVLKQCQAAYEELGFRPLIGMSAVSSRAVRAFLTIVYDRNQAGADERAMRCYERLQQTLTDAGCAAFRLGLHSMSEVARPEPVWQVLSRLKEALDPNNVVAPGRYSG